VEIRYENLNADELQGGMLADLLVNIEAYIEISSDGNIIYSEPAFPVAELARELNRWVSSGGNEVGDFGFSSMSFDEIGAVKIFRTPLGWSVGSIFCPGKSTLPVRWGELAESIQSFVVSVRCGIKKNGPRF
jgi:hypothetical protein